MGVNSLTLFVSFQLHLWWPHSYRCFSRIAFATSGGATAVFTPKDFFFFKFFFTPNNNNNNNFTYPFQGTPNITSTIISSQHNFYLAVFNKVVKQSGLRIFCPMSCLDAIIIITKQSNSPSLFIYLFILLLVACVSDFCSN
jgi:hypothetical protein